MSAPWWADRFAPVYPTPPALDPFAWDVDAYSDAVNQTPPRSTYVLNIFAWSRFCYWAAQSNLAAHFLPTTPATRTRASNGRDVPVAGRNVWLPDDVIGWYAARFGDPTEDYTFPPAQIAQACRRALGGEA